MRDDDEFTECPRCDWESPVWAGFAGSSWQVGFSRCPCCGYPEPRSDDE